jgi:hypothetical protein
MGGVISLEVAADSNKISGLQPKKTETLLPLMDTARQAATKTKPLKHGGTEEAEETKT